MKIFLLTHEREQHKVSNTGALALDIASDFVKRIPWQRTNPDREILELTANNDVLLLYPTDNNSEAIRISDFENLIIIDGTWQQSRKIFNKSEYLKQMPRANVTTGNASNYKLRRNQLLGGLCTVECVIEVLKLKGKESLAFKLHGEYERFNKSDKH